MRLFALSLLSALAMPVPADLYSVELRDSTLGEIYRYSSSAQDLGKIVSPGESVPTLVRGPDSNIYFLGFTLGWGSFGRYDPRTAVTENLLAEPAHETMFPMPFGIAFDRDGVPYVGSTQYPHSEPTVTAVLRYNAATRRLTPFALPADQSRMIAPIGFGPDGHLYAAQEGVGIQRYNGANGEYLGLAIPNADGWPFAYGTFGPDGKIYLGSSSDGVLRYDPISGDLLGVFIPPKSGGLADVTSMSFGDDGLLYVNSRGASDILRYNAITGEFVDVFLSYDLGNPPSYFGVYAIAQVIPEPASAGMIAFVAMVSLRRRRCC